MSDRKSDTREEGDVPELVIPDGGLGTSLPAWLQQRPEWATGLREMETETSAGPEASSAATVAPGVSRELPPPDDSPIHLESILTVDDLPEWLQAIARRSAHDAESGKMLEEPPTGGELIAPTTEVENSPVPAADTRISQPVESEATVIPEVKATSFSTASDSRPYWLNDGVIGGVVAAVVMMLIYVILVATGIL